MYKTILKTVSSNLSVLSLLEPRYFLIRLATGSTYMHEVCMLRLNRRPQDWVIHEGLRNHYILYIRFCGNKVVQLKLINVFIFLFIKKTDSYLSYLCCWLGKSQANTDFTLLVSYNLLQWFSTFFSWPYIFHKIIFWRHIVETKYHELYVLMKILHDSSIKII